jgi:hypothetical protein
MADGPDYAVPEQFAWPWACDEGHRITWGPQDHLDYGKAKGIAYDFAMPSGTPIYAPINGIAHFLLDERPFETNFGNYIEIVTLDGDWLIRLAHLRDVQSGERPVVAGELIGHSGASGVSAAHLHLELLLWDGADWVRPSIGRFGGFFGVPIADLVEDAIIVQNQCQARIALNGNVRALSERALLGEPADLSVPLQNKGLELQALDTLQVVLRHETGQTLVLERQAMGELGPKMADSFDVSGLPTRAGLWQVSHVIYGGGGHSGRLEASGELWVDSLPLVIEDLHMPERTLSVGDSISFEVTVHNEAQFDLSLDDLYVRGLQPDDTRWEAHLNEPLKLEAGRSRRLVLLSSVVPQRSGQWDALQIGFQRDGQTFHLADIEYAFDVSGPELRIDRVHTWYSSKGLIVLLNLVNVGTQVAEPDSIEVWGWQADGETPFVLARERVQPIAPGASSLVLLQRPVADLGEGWRLVEAGYWSSGAYYGLGLGPQPGSHSQGRTSPSP